MDKLFQNTQIKDNVVYLIFIGNLCSYFIKNIFASRGI